MKQDLDIRSLPVANQTALINLFLRMLAPATANQIEELIVRLVGSHPVYGALHELPSTDIERQAQTRIVGIPTSSFRELTCILKLLTPWTPICDLCHEYPLSSLGGKVSELSDGAACPFCLKGHFKTPVTLIRRLNWATGQLMDPSVIDDHRAVSGARVPIVDASILEWVGKVNPMILDMCRRYDVPLYGFLAYAHLRMHLLDELEDACDLLTDEDVPEVFEKMAMWAKRYLLEREVWTVNVNPYLTDGKHRDEFWPLKVGDRTYLIEGQIGKGDKSDVFKARWDHSPTEFVHIKLLVCPDDQDLFMREYQILQSLRRYDDVDSEFYLLFVPKPLQCAEALLPDGSKRLALVTASSHQFDWTLEDIHVQHGFSLDPRHAVWMMNRTLELLNWCHSKRRVHGAILPEHLCVKAETHRVKLLDWSYASGIGGPLVAHSSTWEDFYPEDLLRSKRLEPKHDLAMACRCVLYLLGANPADDFRGASMRDSDQLIKVLYNHALCFKSVATCQDVSSFKDLFAKVARSIYGPPAYVPFVMPAPVA